MSNANKITICLILGFAIGIIIADLFYHYKPYKDDIYINKVDIDSLKDDISKRNFIIIELNKQAQDDIKKISQLNDSDAVNVFLELTSDR